MSQPKLVARITENLTDVQVEYIVEFLVRAFSGDLSVASMTGGNDDLVPLMFRAMLRGINLSGTLYTVCDEAGEIRSVGGWFRPGVRLFDSEEQRALGWNDFMDALSPEAKEWWTQEFPKRGVEPMSRALGNKFLDSWFASLLATDPDYQRRGFATAIVEAALEQAKQDGKIAVLATQSESNMNWYKSLGFEVFGRVDFEGPRGQWPDIFLKHDYK
ncbi:hypothetical protein ONZ45_g5659 [Pleurotus djamor]|nr:hypothetical protein ONZ45_g5659 [Pleurotus djamor]